MANTNNIRVRNARPIVTPAVLYQEVPMSASSEHLVAQTRHAILNILSGRDPRVLVVVGPCSIHDPVAALDYATRLRAVADRLSDDLLIVMRVYFEKPRTTVGWKGLINDPHLDESFDIDAGLRIARKLLRDINELGVPCGTELLDPISPTYISGLMSWGAIGARTTESQVHRELASGLSMPIGFKNGTDGTISIAVDAVLSSAQQHHFLGVTEQGMAGIISTAGNRECHIILRGGAKGTNYDSASVRSAADQLDRAGLRRALIMVDCSHGNSSKDFRRQPAVAADLADQLTTGQPDLMGIMLESNLVEGRQCLENGHAKTYGQSITDGCIGWETTIPVLEHLAKAVTARRKVWIPVRRSLASSLGLNLR
jgi:3-deoxy-7-phosphoheptulonate synthase